MKRLLCLTASMNAGGAETFLMKVYRQLNRSKYQMDFCVTTEENYYAEEIHALGGKIYVVPPKSKKFLDNFLGIGRIVRENEYDYVIRVCENSLAALDLLAAKLNGAKHLAMRSSNAGTDSTVVRILHRLFFFLPRWVPNIKLAPSRLAGEYTFGKKAVEKGNVVLLHNGIDLEKFRFSQEIRNEVRQKMDVGDCRVIGHVGRFFPQKNHEQLIDIFAAYHKQEPNSVLWLVGEGPLQSQIFQKVQRLGLEKAVCFLGLRNDVNQLLMAMDAVVFPSFFEGMPNVVVEAQATGLNCLIADTITPEANVIGRVCFASLRDSAEQWAEKIRLADLAERSCAIEQMKANGYDIADVVNTFTQCVFDEK